MNLPQINLSNIVDVAIRRNFEALKDYFRRESPLLGFRFFELTFTAAETGKKIPHNLGYQPKDVIVTSQIGSGTVVFNYDLFDSTNLNITVSGPSTVANPTVIRFFCGRYQQGPT